MRVSKSERKREWFRMEKRLAVRVMVTGNVLRA